MDLQDGAALFGQAQSPTSEPALLDGSQIFGQPAPSAPTPSAPDQNGLIDGSQLFGQPQEPSIGEKVASYIPEPVKEAGSMVAKVLRPLAYPLNAETAAILKAGDFLGVPGAKELKQQLNPEGKIFPEAFPSDISDFYLDKASKAAGMDHASTAMKIAAWTGKTGLGFGINVLMDPLSLVGIGELTDSAQAIRKMGGTLEEGANGAKVVNRLGLDTAAAKERNLLSIRAPFTDATLDIRGKPVQDAISMIGQMPGVKQAASVIRALSPDTGVESLDTAGRTHDAFRRGDPVDINNRYGKLKDALKMTSDEDRLASALVENTSNLAPKLPGSLLRASKKSWADEAMLTRQMGVSLPDIAKKMGIELAPGREEAITQAALLSKRALAESLEDKFKAGVLTHDNIAEKTLENYLPRVMDPNYKGVKNLAEYEAKLKSDAAYVDKLTKGSFVSSIDPTRMREATRGMNFSEAQSAMKEATGLDNYFITDPVKAAQARLIESKKLLRDSEYLDQVKDFGERLKPSDARKAGMASIDHPELEGKTVVLKYPNGEIKTVRHQDLYYPKEIASKVQSRIAPEALTGLKATWVNYNRVFRSMIFMSSPGIRLGNSMDNVLKTAAVTGKDFMQSSRDALEVLLGKSSGFRSAATALRPNGVFYDGATLRSLIDKFGLTHTGAWAEGMEPFLAAGKRLSFQEAMQRPGTLLPRATWQRAQSMVKAVDTFGAHGENTAKVALFLQRLRSGFEPEMANSEVTKWLFDYTRNSPAMENVRFAMPFMQHPMKTLMVAHELLGTAPGTYNFIQNTFPHVVANAFHDPVTQLELNGILPESIKQRDGIAGPFIPGNTWMASILGSGKPGPFGSMAWFDPRIGLRIINHFDYFDKFGSQRLFGETSPVIQGLLGAAMGRDFSAKQGVPWASLDYANGAQNVSNRFNYLFDKIVGGVTPFPNAEKILLQSAGIGNPQYFEPATVLVLKGIAGQFGGITNLDRDITSKIMSTAYAIKDQEKQLASTLTQELKGQQNSGSVGRYLSQKYGEIRGVSPVDIMKQVTQSQEEMGRAQLGAQALGGGMSSGDFIARIKGLHDNLRQLNQAYQTLGSRMIQMNQGK